MGNADAPTIHALPRIPTFIGKCCREWVLAVGGRGRCGLCGEVPTYLRGDTYENKGEK